MKITPNSRTSVTLPTSTRESDGWDGAACIGRDPEMWFPSLKPGPTPALHRLPPDTQRAISICADCALRDPCLEEAMTVERDLKDQYRYGIFGGLLPSQRARLADRRAS